MGELRTLAFALVFAATFFRVFLAKSNVTATGAVEVSRSISTGELFE